MDKYRIPVLDAFPWQESVISKSINIPPISPKKGDRYLIPLNVDNNSVWKNKQNYIVWFDGFTWHYDSPLKGWTIYIDDIDEYYRWNDKEWVSNSINILKPSNPDIEISKPIINNINKRIFYVSSSKIVDGNGSEYKPFNTIRRALDEIIRIQDNDLSYTIKLSHGIYNEDIILENQTFKNIIFEGDVNNLTTVQSLISTKNNNKLKCLHFNNIKFNNIVVCEGMSNNTEFGQELIFNECIFSSNINLVNINSIYFLNYVQIESDINLKNITNVLFDTNTIIFGQLRARLFNIKVNPDDKIPLSWNGFATVECYNKIERTLDWDLKNNGKVLLCLKYGGLLGLDNETYIIPTNVVYKITNSILVGHYICDGLLILKNSFVSGTLTERDGKINFEIQSSDQLQNNSTVPGKSITDALNYLNTNGTGGSIGVIDTDIIINKTPIQGETLSQVLEYLNNKEQTTNMQYDIDLGVLILK